MLGFEDYAFKIKNQIEDHRQDLEILRNFRENNERKSNEVVAIWENSLSQNSLDTMGVEKPTVLEQVLIAAVDCSKMGIARQCVKELHKEFPNSCRVRILESMIYEADENYSKALQILNDIVKQDVTNSAARKRKVAIYKSIGRNAEAIKELTEYLKTFMTDLEAWQELSELYIGEYDYGKAAFCLEELILHNPHNHLLYQRYADIKYSQGGSENLDIARIYYCQALKLNPGNIRALYGLYLTSSAPNNQKTIIGKKKDAVNKALEWSLKDLKKRYEEAQVDGAADYLAALEI